MRTSRQSVITCRPLLAAAIAAAVAPWLAAEDADPQASFVERLQVNVRNVEVFVTDKKGRPIDDLTAEDFEVFEDGEAMQLTNFLAPAGGPPAAVEPPGIAAASSADSDALVDRAPAAEPDRHLILFVDNLNIRPHNRQRVIDEARKFLDGAAGHRVMVASHVGHVDIRQGFTDDLGLVHSALDNLEKLSGAALAQQAERTSLLREAQQILMMVRQANSAPDPSSVAEAENLARFMQMTEDEFSSLMQQVESTSQRLHLHSRAAVQAIYSFVDALAALPGRKALVYVSDGVAMRPGEELFWAMGETFQQGRRLRFRDRSVPTPGGSGGDGRSGNNQGGEPLDSGFDSSELRNLVSYRTRSQRHSLARYFEELTALANTHQVSFYTIDARGGASGFTDASVEGRLGAVYSAGLKGIRDANLWETLDVMSSKTGGLTLTGGDVQGLLRRATDDFSSYYSLGYSPPHLGDGKRHTIKVKVKRRGAKLRYRKSYVDKPLRGKIEDRTTAALLLDLDDNRHGIFIETLAPARGDKKGIYSVPMLVKIPLAEVALLPRGEVHACDAKLYITSLGPGGSPGPVREIPFSIEVPNHDLGKVFGAYYTARMEMLLPAGEQKVAVGFWDQMAAEGSFLSHQVTIDATPTREL